MPYIIISYYFHQNPHSFEVKPHGNSNQRRPYQPTSSSTRNLIKDKVRNSFAGPSQIYGSVFIDVGGIFDAESASDFPRIDQVKYERHKIRQKQSTDDITDLITLSSEKDTPISNLQFNPAVRFVVAPKETLNDLAEYCTGHKDGDSPSSFVIDKTFNVGRFYVTTTCYQNKKIFNRLSTKSPWIPGPALFHVEQNNFVYRYFAMSLIEKEPRLKDIKCLGMDREKAIKNGITSELTSSTPLYCKKHVAVDIMRKMNKLKISAAVQQIIMADIFDKDSTQTKGAVDVDDEDEFVRYLQQLYPKWNTFTGSDDFSKYFDKCIKQDVIEGMLLPVRKSAGYGANFFYSNPVESVHYKFKNRI